MPWFENSLGEHLWYEDAGCGIPLVFLHGWCMSSAVWKNQFIHFEDSFRLIAPDLRGHGKSRAVSGNHTFERYAADLADLVQYLGLKKIILIGWSMGGQIALQALDDLSDRLAGLVLVSATPCFTASDDFPYGLARNEVSGMHLKVVRNLERALNRFHGRMFADGEIGSPQEAVRVKELFDSVVLPDASAAVDALDSLVVTDMCPVLGKIAVPVLILNGDCDLICLPQASDYLADHIKLSFHKVFTGCGHAFFITRSEQFNNEINKYARRVCDLDA